MAKDAKPKKHFFKEFKAELKRIVWPTPNQLLKNTTAVVTIVLITAIIVFILDITFDTLNKYGIDVLKSKTLENSTVVNDTNNITNTIDETNNSVENENANQNIE